MIIGHILLHMCRNSSFQASGYNFDDDIGFSHTDLMSEWDISAIGKRFQFFTLFIENWPYFYFWLT